MSSNPILISVSYIKQKQKVLMLEQISLDLTEIRLNKESGVHKSPSTWWCIVGSDTGTK